MTAVEIVATVERNGGELVIRDGTLFLRGAKRIPAHLVGEIRAHRDEIRAIVAAVVDVEQLPLIPAAPPEPTTFMDREDARFLALCAEFGIVVDAVRR